ncbi:MAG: hypothetical protein Q8P13_02815 [bacterium]|nr:hypothetical protein [bacterium]
MDGHQAKAELFLSAGRVLESLRNGRETPGMVVDRLLDLIEEAFLVGILSLGQRAQLSGSTQALPAVLRDKNTGPWFKLINDYLDGLLEILRSSEQARDEKERSFQPSHPDAPDGSPYRDPKTP